MFSNLFTKFWCILLLFHCTTSFLQFDDEDRSIDMDDLMRVKCQSEPEIDPKMILTPYEDLNKKYSTANEHFDQNFPFKKEYYHVPISEDINQNEIMSSDIINEKNVDKKSKKSKNDPLINKLENLMIHPLWVTLPEEQRLKSKPIEKKNEEQDVNDSKLSDIDRIRRLQESVKENLCKENCKPKHFWEKLIDNEEQLNNNNKVDSYSLGHENQLVIRALDDFYGRLFDSLVQVVPSLKFEDPFSSDYENRARSNANMSATSMPPDSSSNINRDTLGQYIDKKLEKLKKEPLPLNRLPEIITLTRILESFPNLLLLNYPSNIKYDLDRVKWRSPQLRTTYSDMINENRNSRPSIHTKNVLQLIPQIKYNYQAETNSSSNANKNGTNSTSNLWYYSNLYTEPPPNAEITTGTTKDTEKTPASMQWPLHSLNNENMKIYKEYPNLGNLLHRSDMSRRNEWDEGVNEKELLSNVDDGKCMENHQDKNSQDLRTTEINLNTDDRNNDEISKELHTQPKWLKNPLTDHLEYLMNRDNKYNKPVLKLVSKLNDMIKDNGDFRQDNRKFAPLLHNQQSPQPIINYEKI